MKKLLSVTAFLATLVLAFAVGAATAAPAGLPEELPAAYYVHSDNLALKALLGVNHQFDSVFSTELSGQDLGYLKSLGVRTEPVQIRRIEAKPVCGDGICQGNETKTCLVDCPSGPTPTPTPEPGRACFPEAQLPWGVVKVNGGSGGAGVTVAVLDSGVDSDHPDLVGNLIDCRTEVTHHSADARDCEDASGHGTHVSGTVLANAGLDGLGIYGVAPQASLMTVKVCDRRGWCFGDDVAAGVYYAVDHGANIINMSFSGDNPDPQELVAIDYATSSGVLVVAAAGNDGPSYGSIDYPAAYVKVVAAGAINSSENVPSWSSRGINDGDYLIEEKEIEFGTPGVGVESANKNGCYDTWSGTSMATPHVSGLAAKLWQGSAAATRGFLQGIARDIGDSGDDTATGFGLPVAP